LAHELQAADHGPYLVVQERARGSLNDDLITAPADIEPFERPQGRVRLALRGAKGREIVPAEKRGCGRRHRLGVKRDRYPPDTIVVECGRRAPRQDAVAVVARRGAVA